MTCRSGCQYAIDTGMPEYTCGGQFCETPESPLFGEQSLVAGSATKGDCGDKTEMLREHENAGRLGQTSHLSANINADAGRE